MADKSFSWLSVYIVEEVEYKKGKALKQNCDMLKHKIELIKGVRYGKPEDR